ncbi:methylenetetrahydrofolate reductase [Corynebacterium sp. L4756]|uniref:methylenetetrahydrofolate reductase n=1 Tax=unclassified Corynebacterium TaxID=2624378 RepID=UPI00374D3D07
MVPRMSASAPLDYLELDAGVKGVSASNAYTRTALSFEVIPPRDDADDAKVDNLLDVLESYNPDYIAVTSSKRSGWLEGTAKFIERISTTTSMRPLAHLACTAGNKQQLVEWVNVLVDAGVRGFLALRGDLEPGQATLPAGYLQHADELVRLIRQLEGEQAARFAAGRLAVGVACYPNGHVESANADEDFDVILAKQRLGADLAITQLFFDAEDYLKFAQRARLAGTKIPLIPGIMPVTSLKRAQRMGELSGLKVPQGLIEKLSRARSPDEEYAIGMAHTVELAQAVLAGGAGCLHIYTHNNASITQELLSSIGIQPQEGKNND